MEITLAWDHHAAYQRIGCWFFVKQKIHNSTTGNVLPSHKYEYKSMKFHASSAQVLDCNDDAHLGTIFAPSTEVLVVPQHPYVASVDRERRFQCESLEVVLCWSFFNYL